jgi:hypothetical protein
MRYDINLRQHVNLRNKKGNLVEFGAHFVCTKNLLIEKEQQTKAKKKGFEPAQGFRV